MWILMKIVKVLISEVFYYYEGNDFLKNIFLPLEKV